MICPYIEIGNRRVGSGYPVYVVAEISANHQHSFEEAVRLVHSAKECGADAVKLQTYTPDTITLNCDAEPFQINQGTIWDGRRLYDLYTEAYTPWDWQPRLQGIAHELGLELFSTPFDDTAVEFLEKMDAPAYKIASFELVDVGLIRRVARTGKPVIISTGMATREEISEAVNAARAGGAAQIALLKCTSAYPAPPEEMNLRTIPHMKAHFGLPVGLSDHTLGTNVPIAAVSLGACILEKHLTMSRNVAGPDSSFSLEPSEFRSMVEIIRLTEKALGEVRYEVSEQESVSRIFRRSLFVVEHVKAGEPFTKENVRSIRPGYGLPCNVYERILGRIAATHITRGTPLSWDLVH